ncbi:DUF2809 domain-containing protein [Microbacterium sp. W1N]|uniref:ribosomal maturation YjgA family protein n=1 Tax=Microbacterium festucae TaxID=2977531 RepID=UPI0021C158C0|nr:DUF2809 domain-containing protein [Microbacterium festucae]MCT9821189.1 DUF2809 domain-containing protein [Microbacterium festucae]
MAERPVVTAAPPRLGTARRRLIAAGLLVVTIAAGLGITRLPDSAASDIAGDALYTVAAYLFVVVLAPRWSPVVVGAVAGGWSVAVELLQLTGLPQQWGAAFAPARLVFGTVFDARDLGIYLTAAAFCALVDAGLRRLRSQNSSIPTR